MRYHCRVEDCPLQAKLSAYTQMVQHLYKVHPEVQGLVCPTFSLRSWHHKLLLRAGGSKPASQSAGPVHGTQIELLKQLVSCSARHRLCLSILNSTASLLAHVKMHARSMTVCRVQAGPDVSQLTSTWCLALLSARK